MRDPEEGATDGVGNRGEGWQHEYGGGEATTEGNEREQRDSQKIVKSARPSETAGGLDRAAHLPYDDDGLPPPVAGLDRH